MAVDPYQTFLDTLATSEGDFEDRLTRLAELGIRHQEAARKKNYYKDLELDGIGGALDDLIGVIDNPETAKEAEYQLAAYRGEAGNNVAHKINVLTLQGKLKRKTEDVATYGHGIQEASDMIDRGETTFEAKDYENIETLYQNANAKREAGGLKLHTSPMAYLSSELDRMDKIIGKISPGMKVMDDKGNVTNVFKYGKSDVDIYRNVYEHRQNIDAATKALFGDNKITKKEAEALAQGADFYAATKVAAEKDAERLFSSGQSSYNWWRNFHNKVKQGEYDFDPEEEGVKELLKTVNSTDLEKLKSGKRDAMLGVIAHQRNIYEEEMDYQNDKHFNWTGLHLIDRKNKPNRSNLDNDEYYETAESVDAQGNEVSTEPEPEPSPYAELEEKALNSKSLAIQKKGVKTVKELEQFDEEEISINDQIESLKKDHQTVKDRKKEVDEKIKSLSYGLVIDGVLQKDTKKKFRKLQQESRELAQKLKHHGTYWKISFKGKIDKLENQLDKLKKDRDAKLTRIENLVKIK